MDFIPYRLFSIVPPFSVVSKCALAGGLFKPPSEREVAREAWRKEPARVLFSSHWRLRYKSTRALPHPTPSGAPSRREAYLAPLCFSRKTKKSKRKADEQCSSLRILRANTRRLPHALGSLVHKTNLRFLLRELAIGLLAIRLTEGL